MFCSVLPENIHWLTSADPEGGTGGPDPPPGKSQVIWVSIGNKELDPPPPPPPPPLEKVGPPPGKCWTPSGTMKNDRFLWNWPFDFCKISWGLKKNNVRAFFARRTWTPPPWRKFLDPRMVNDMKSEWERKKFWIFTRKWHFRVKK